MTDYLNSLLSLPGLSAKHAWRAGQFVLGDNQGALPRYKLKTIKGLWSTPDSDDNRRRRYGQPGEYATPGAVGGKTIAYGGLVQASTMVELEYACNLLKAAHYYDAQLSEGQMTIARNAAVGGHSYSFTARLVQVEIDEEQTFAATDRPSPWQRPFVVSFRLSDPRVYVTDAQYQQSCAAAGGGNDPFLDVQNAGAYDAIPVIRLTGPSVSPIISRPGAQLATLFTLAAGEWADVDFAARKITKNTGADLTNQRDIPNSTWWDAGQEGIPGGVPGPTVTRLTMKTAAGHPGVGSSFRVTFLPGV